MSYVTVLWSMAAAASLVLGVVHALVWAFDRRALPNLSFAIVAVSVACVAGLELAMMHAGSPMEWGSLVRWLHVPMFFAIAGIVWFVHLYLGSDRYWLALTVVALRLAILVANFAREPNFNFDQIHSLERMLFLGEEVSVAGSTVHSPWQWLAVVSNLFLVAYIADGVVATLRRGGADARRRALLVGGGTLAFSILSVVQTQLVIYGLVRAPVMITLSFLVTVVAMAFELSRDLMVAMGLARELSESEQRLDLAASAAGLGLWSLDPARRQVWATGRARDLWGLPADTVLDLDSVIEAIHPDDAADARRALDEALRSGAGFTLEFRVRTGDGGKRWLEARGNPGTDPVNSHRLVRGVLRDVTDRRQAQDELSELRRDLAHAGRVTVLGQLVSSIAHELSQPLGAVLRNAEAAERLLCGATPDLAELREIIADIRKDDRRAADVIDRLRTLLKRRSLDAQPISVEGLVQDVASLVRSDAAARNVAIDYAIEPGLPLVSGDRVHLSQVLLNLIVNGMDAAVGDAAGRARVLVSACRCDEGSVELTVEDSGPGIPPGGEERIFEPFFTTKSGGMGMGLPVSRTIVEAHGGRLSVSAGRYGGAMFRMTLNGAAGAAA